MRGRYRVCAIYYTANIVSPHRCFSAQYDIAAHLKQWRLYFRERPMECVGITTRVLFGFHGGYVVRYDCIETYPPTTRTAHKSSFSLVTLDPMTLLRINESHLSTDGLLEIFLDVLSFCVDYCRAKIQRHMMLKVKGCARSRSSAVFQKVSYIPLLDRYRATHTNGANRVVNLASGVNDDSAAA